MPPSQDDSQIDRPDPVSLEIETIDTLRPEIHIDVVSIRDHGGRRIGIAPMSIVEDSSVMDGTGPKNLPRVGIETRAPSACAFCRHSRFEGDNKFLRLGRVELPRHRGSHLPGHPL